MTDEKLNELKKLFEVDGVQPIDVVETYPNCFMPIYQKHIDEVQHFVTMQLEDAIDAELELLIKDKP